MQTEYRKTISNYGIVQRQKANKYATADKHKIIFHTENYIPLLVVRMVNCNNVAER